MKNKIMILMLVAVILLSGCSYFNKTKENKSEQSLGIFVDYKDDGNIYVDLFSSKYNYSKFEVHSNMQKEIKNKKIRKNDLVKVEFFINKDKASIKNLQKIQEAIIQANFEGMADENFAEIKIGSKVFIFEVDEKLKSKFNDMKDNSRLKIKIKNPRFEEGNPIIVEIIK